jgi:hypothetical protein
LRAVVRLILMIRAASAYDTPYLTRHRNRARFGVSYTLRSVLRTDPIMRSCYCDSRELGRVIGAVGELYKLGILRREKVLEQRDAKLTAL